MEKADFPVPAVPTMTTGGSRRKAALEAGSSGGGAGAFAMLVMIGGALAFTGV